MLNPYQFCLVRNRFTSHITLALSVVAFLVFIVIDKEVLINWVLKTKISIDPDLLINSVQFCRGIFGTLGFSGIIDSVNILYIEKDKYAKEELILKKIADSFENKALRYLSLKEGIQYYHNLINDRSVGTLVILMVILYFFFYLSDPSDLYFSFGCSLNLGIKALILTYFNQMYSNRCDDLIYLVSDLEKNKV